MISASSGRHFPVALSALLVGPSMDMWHDAGKAYADLAGSREFIVRIHYAMALAGADYSTAVVVSLLWLPSNRLDGYDSFSLRLHKRRSRVLRGEDNPRTA